MAQNSTNPPEIDEEPEKNKLTKEGISIRLRKISKNKPKIDLHQTQYRGNSFENPERKLGESEKNPNKIQWPYNLRGGTPAYRIPKAERFKQEQFPFINQPTQFNLRENIARKGVTFPKSPRKQLFTIEVSPSGADYEKKRYLQTLQTRISHRKKSLPTPVGRGEHLRGGTIYKFENYEDLYYPHTKKLNYNDRDIKIMMADKKRHAKSIEI